MHRGRRCNKLAATRSIVAALFAFIAPLLRREYTFAPLPYVPEKFRIPGILPARGANLAGGCRRRAQKRALFIKFMLF